MAIFIRDNGQQLLNLTMLHDIAHLAGDVHYYSHVYHHLLKKKLPNKWQYEKKWIIAILSFFFFYFVQWYVK